jgi:hypothetical protein
MQIRIVSSLTPDDENEFASALLSAIGSLLDRFPIAYAVRIETSNAKVYQLSHPVPWPGASETPVAK